MNPVNSPVAQPDQDLLKLRQKIERQFEQTKGDFALAFEDISDQGQTIHINEREMFHAASTMKTPVMIEIFKQAREGKFSLKDSMVVKNDFKSIVDSSSFHLKIGNDGDEALYDYVGKKRSIHDLIYDMITYSSNLATNILIQKVGAKNVTQTMRQMGADSIKVLRGVQDLKAYRKGLNNRTSAYDLMVMFDKLARRKAVSPEFDREMIDILEDQHYNDIIPAELPGDVKVAHKTGWITGVHHDSGIVYLPGGRKYVLVILSKNVRNDNKAIQMMADVSKEIYDFVSHESVNIK